MIIDHINKCDALFLGGSVGVISNQPAVDAASITIEEEAPESPVLIRRQWKNDDTLDSRLTSQADWIRQYVEQQEEVNITAYACFR